MPDSSHTSAHLPSHSPGTPQTKGGGRSEWTVLWMTMAEELRLPQIVGALQRWIERHPRLFHALGGRVVSEGCDPNPFPRVSLFRRSNR